ncbi:MAG: hypothetical protein RLY99_663 [Pseudomonadota bacterium]|jgi:hypothetical protein
MKYTIALIDEQNHESLDRGLAYEKFLLGPSNSSAPLELQSYGVKISDHTPIARIEPVHIHAARDHLVLTSTDILDLRQDEADALFESVRDIFEEMATAIYRPTPNRWFIEPPSLQSLSTVSTEQAQGRNIDHWMPVDTTNIGVARQWRKWQNDIQMIWFNHPVNEARASEGMLAVNSVWISGIGSLSEIKPNQQLQEAKLLHSPDSCLNVLAGFLKKQHISSIASSDLPNTLSLISLNDPGITEIWNMAGNAMINGDIEEIVLIDFPEGQERTRHISINQFPKKGFGLWKKPFTPSLQDILRS